MIARRSSWRRLLVAVVLIGAVAVTGCGALGSTAESGAPAPGEPPRAVIASSTVDNSAPALERLRTKVRGAHFTAASVVSLPGSGSGVFASWTATETTSEFVKAIEFGDLHRYRQATGMKADAREVRALRWALFGVRAQSDVGTTYFDGVTPDSTSASQTIRLVRRVAWSTEPSAIWMRVVRVGGGHHVVATGRDGSIEQDEINRLGALTDQWDPPASERKMMSKPVIYLYPRHAGKVVVQLDLSGVLTTSAPVADPLHPAWRVTAEPNGDLTDASGARWPYLYWEGTSARFVPDMSRGFVVAQSDLESFFERSLRAQGLSAGERADFEEYWLSRMRGHAYYLVTFQDARYEAVAKLHVEPSPDTVLRVMMAYRPLDRPVDVLAQSLSAKPRRGFTVVEWGGCEVR